MRRKIAEKIHSMMLKDRDIYLLYGDLGYSVLDDIIKDFPKRAINCGIAEQNMISVASGLSLAGKKPVVYSIAPFVSSRVLEQIKLDLCQQNTKVAIVATGSGLAYGSLGPTHHCLEDIAALSCLPNLTLFTPVDKNDAGKLFEDFWNYYRDDNVGYFRLTEDNVDFTEYLDKNTTGGDTGVAIIANGSIYGSCIEAHEKYGVDLYSWNEIREFDEELYDNFKNLFDKYNKIVTVEESYSRGGFGSYILELMNKVGAKTDLEIIAPPTEFIKEAGSQEYLRGKMGIDSGSVSSRVKEILSG